MNKNQKLAVFDFDGTITQIPVGLYVNDDTIDYPDYPTTKANMAVLKRIEVLKSEGYKVVIVTGRREAQLGSMLRFLDRHKVDIPRKNIIPTPTAIWALAGDFSDKDATRMVIDLMQTHKAQTITDLNPNIVYDDDRKVLAMAQIRGKKMAVDKNNHSIETFDGEI